MIIAEGTAKDSITFTRYDDATVWGGIKFVNDEYHEPKPSTMNYCIIEYAKTFGISVIFANPILNNILVRRNGCNLKGNSGNGITMGYSKLKLTNSAIIENNIGSETEWNLGGGLYIAAGSIPIIENVIISGNMGGKGAGIYIYESRPILNNVIINDNKAIEEGGGICCDGGIVIMNNSLMINNTAEKGGGFYSKGKKDKINNCIIAYNIGDGIESSGLINSYVFGNSPQDFRNCGEWYGVPVKINQYGDSCDVYDNIIADPQFVDYENGDYHLLESSPCIDAGINDLVTTISDFDGNMRIWDGRNDGIMTVDIGAYEFDAPPVLKMDTIVNNDFEDGLMTWDVATESNINWSVISNSEISFKGENCLKLTSDVSGGNVLLISPQFNLPAAETSIISFWCKELEGDGLINKSNYPISQLDNPTRIEIKISDSGKNILDFEETLKDVQISEGYWSKVEYDLSIFAGKKIYLALYSKFLDWNSIYIDDICVATTGEITKVSEQYSNPKQTTYCYPNPFHQTTTFKFNLESNDNVRLSIHNSLGQKVVVLIDKFLSLGSHELIFNAMNLPQGTYFYKLQAGKRLETGKLLLINN